MSAPYSQELTISKSLNDIARSLSKLWGFCWIDSAANQLSSTNRYHILAALPYLTLIINDKGAFIQKKGQLEKFDTDEPYQTITKLLPRKIPALSHLPFQGGGIGFIAYELGKRILGIKTKNKSLNGLPELCIHFYDFALIHDLKDKSFHLCSRNEKACTVDKIKRFEKALYEKADKKSFEVTKNFSPLISEEKYGKGFKVIKKALYQGDAYQVNYTHPFLSQFKGSSLEAYLLLREKNQCPFSAYLDIDNQHILSLSPERFLKVNDKRMIEVRPIKGTVKKEQDKNLDSVKKDWLTHSKKNIAENTMIVDLMRNDLSKIIKPFSLSVKALCQLLSLPSVHHLESVIEGQLKETITFDEIFKALFPCGSITGAPKKSAMQFISDTEPYQRSVYCGAIGYISACGKMDFNVAIRTLVREDDDLMAYAGGGVVMDSTEGEEYQESLAKLSKIMELRREAPPY